MKYNIEDISIDIASIAVKALLYEVSHYPSPGLVNPVSNGAHDNMDFYTFIDSIGTLIKPFILYSEVGIKHSKEEELFSKLREIGKIAESEMFKITKGVNTHKGAIFLMGISICAVSRAIYYNYNFFEIKNIIKKLTLNLTEMDFKNIKSNKNLTHGEEVYLKYGLGGIRSEVQNGLPIIFNFSLDFYSSCKNLSLNDKLVHSLIGIMQVCNDTNILYRKGMKWLNHVKEHSKEIIKSGGMYTIEGRNKIQLFDKLLTNNNVSPGGSADILSTTIFFNEIREKYFIP